MSIRELIYPVRQAAYFGDLQRIKEIFDRCTEDEIHTLVDVKTYGDTPLVVACRNGRANVVEYLIGRCNADVEQPCSIVFKDKTIKITSPLVCNDETTKITSLLGCAAFEGRLEVVRLLVRLGANVNGTTRTTYSPLLAACHYGCFEVVKFLVDHGADIEVADSEGYTCLMIACSMDNMRYHKSIPYWKGHKRIVNFAFSLNVDVNRKNVKGDTALHECAKSGNLKILKLLTKPKRGAKMDFNWYGITPILAASIARQTRIVEYLFQSPDLVSRVERINALELLGATYVDVWDDTTGALQLWKKAMDERYNGSPCVLEKPPQHSTVAAYNHAREVRDPEGLADLSGHWDEIRMQALVIRERILGQSHPYTIFYIEQRGYEYIFSGKYERCLSLRIYILDMRQRKLEPLDPRTLNTWCSIIHIFEKMIDKQERTSARDSREPPGFFTDLLSVLHKSILAVQAYVNTIEKLPAGKRDITKLHCIVVISLQLACLLIKLFPDLTEKQVHEVRREVRLLVEQNIREFLGTTALHFACSRNTYIGYDCNACQFPHTQLAEMLLTVGADVRATDSMGNTPLHLVASYRQCPKALINTMLDEGAHLDAVNSYGKTCLQLIQDKTFRETINPFKYTTLSCLAARVVRRHGLSFKGRVPMSIKTFIEQH